MDEYYFLKSARIGFRTWSLDDIGRAIELWGDLEVTKFIGGPFSNSQIQRRLLTEKSILRLHNIQYWPIFMLETNEFIGCCGLRPYKPDERIYEIGFNIKKEYWRQGYAMEAAQKVVAYTFSNLKAKALFAGHHPENVISKELLEKLGFQYISDEYFEPTGLDHPSYVLNYSNLE